MGHGFTSILNVDKGRITDGVGGSAGPMGMGSPGALDGEVVYLLGSLKKSDLFRGGVVDIARAGSVKHLIEMYEEGRPRAKLAINAYLEQIVRHVRGSHQRREGGSRRSSSPDLSVQLMC